jgi:tripartite-type tricarboxylate transporter receptor subunit TctC
MKEFVAYAKREPGKLSYGSAGIGTAPHMAMELLKSMAGIDVQHIPYRGVSQSVTDILGGRVSGMILNVLTAKPHVDSGAMRALAVTGLRRTDAMPNVPTIDEAAVPKYEALQWFGILAPAGTPPAVVNLLQTRIAEGFRTPEMKARLAADGAEAVVSQPAEFGKLIDAEIEKWTAVAKAANIQPED